MPIYFNFSLNENGSCMYSLNSGVINYSMTANSSGTGFNAANSSIADGSYTVNAYCNDTAGNQNNTKNVSFSVENTHVESTQIGNCTILDVANTIYTQTANIVPISATLSSHSACIDVTAENVTFNGNGFWIKNTNLAATGIYSNQRNTTIKNCNVSMKRGSDGIALEFVNNSIIFNNTITLNQLYLYYSSNNNITGNIVFNSSVMGIYLIGSSNNLIDGNNLSFNGNPNTGFGINLNINSGNNTLRGNMANNNYGRGFDVSDNGGNTLINNVANSNADTGFFITSSGNNLTGNTANSNIYWGFALMGSNNNLVNNTANSNSRYGLYFLGSNNLIYNNFLKNINNTYFAGSRNNSFNTTLQAGTNIMGGNLIGGNFWANPSGTGFSETCIDTDLNGICDSAFTLATNNIDYLPLAKQS